MFDEAAVSQNTQCKRLASAVLDNCHDQISWLAKPVRCSFTILAFVVLSFWALTIVSKARLHHIFAYCLHTNFFEDKWKYKFSRKGGVFFINVNNETSCWFAAGLELP
ncbi:unnamed protein product [Brassica napus]|uniref:(rape) hypothetical protein n=1 Tax=Brassica napus TaxID=3708 RepID=A0A816JQ18_BRANA|nr:unnamed protein product [Brassica napus]